MSITVRDLVIALAVVALIAVGGYLGNNWIQQKKEKAREVARNFQKDAEDARINQIKEMVEKGGGTYHDGIAISDVSPRIGPVQLNSAAFETKEAHLRIMIGITNCRPDKQTINYQSWRTGAAPDRQASVTDNRGRPYARIDLAGVVPLNGVESASLKYGARTNDVLVFERVVDKVEYLDLRLPAGNAGGAGMIEIRIPASKWGG